MFNHENNKIQTKRTIITIIRVERNVLEYNMALFTYGKQNILEFLITPQILYVLQYNWCCNGISR